MIRWSIKEPFLYHHNKVVIRRELVNNVKIIKRSNNKLKLLIKEALLIQQKGSTINKQFNCFPNTLKLYTKLINFPSRLNLNETVKGLGQKILDNNEEFNDGVSLTSTQIPNSTLNYNQSKFR